MQVICAWCHALIRVVPGDGISHGICTTCAKQLLHDAGLDDVETVAKENRDDDEEADE